MYTLTYKCARRSHTTWGPNEAPGNCAKKVLHEFQQEEMVEELSHHTIHKTGKSKLTDLFQNRQYQTLRENYIQVNIR